MKVLKGFTISSATVTIKVLMVRWWCNKQHKKTVKRIRNHMLFFGYDLSHLTDEKLEEHLTFASKQVAMCGVTAKEATQSLLYITKAIHNST